MNTWNAYAYSQFSVLCRLILIARKSLTLVAIPFFAVTCDAQQSNQPVSSLMQVRGSSVTIHRLIPSSAPAAETVVHQIVIPGVNHPLANDIVNIQATTLTIDRGNMRAPITSSRPLPIEIAPTIMEKPATAKPSIARIAFSGPPERE